MASTGFAREITDSELISHVSGIVAQTAPDAEEDEWTSVAEFVYRHLLNAADDFARFHYEGIDANGHRRPFEFQLLVLREADSGIAVGASAEAINGFLKAFDLDVSDAEAALSVILERQISDGRFEAATRTAAQASRFSLAEAARIGELLEDTRRDVASVDWRGAMRADLERARHHVAARIIDDDKLLDHVARGTESDDRATAETSGQIAELLTDCKRLHLALEDRMVRAHRTFPDAQSQQRLAYRRRLRLLSIDEHIFRPTLGLLVDDAQRVTDAFARVALGRMCRACRISPR